MVYKSRPENFNPKFDVVGCFVRRGNDIVLLHRQDHKPQGGTWGIPSGKVDDGESLAGAMAREIKEELSWEIAAPELNYLSSIDVNHDGYDFSYHMFSLHAAGDKQITISTDEHKEARWVGLGEIHGLPLIEDLDECIRLLIAG